MRTRSLHESEVVRLLAAMQWQNALAVRVSLETGLRIGDVLKLMRTDLNGCVITYTASKTGKQGRVTVSETLARDLRANANLTWLFPGRWQKHPLTRQAVWKDMKRAASVLQRSEGVSPHSARKSFAVRLMDETGSLDEVQKALQHESAAVTELYAFADEAEPTVLSRAQCQEIAREIVERLSAVLGLTKAGA